MTKQYLSEKDQTTLLTSWIEGKNREDLSLLDPALFTLKALYKAATEEEKNLTQLYSEKKTDGLGIKELLTAAHSDTAIIDYLAARAQALMIQRDLLAEKIKQPGADLPAITAKLLQTQAAIDQREIKPAAANLSANFIKEITEEATAKKIKYGRGFEDLTRRAGAMRRGQLIVLAARPAVGKSAAALQIGYNVASTGAKVLFFPLEMTTQETLERLILQQQIVDNQAALKAPMDKEKADIVAFLDRVETAGNFLIYEGVNNLETITQTIKEQRPDLVIIDQLTQVRTTARTKDIRERYITITADLKAAAMEFNTAILLLTQLNRAATDQNAPTLENLHESDATGQNADVVLLLARKDSDENRKTYTKQEELSLHVVKNRGGASGFVVGEMFKGETFTFYGITK